jgi:hypothetical protein
MSDKKTPKKRGRGRPPLPKGHVKGKIVPVRLDNDELKLFTKAADKSEHETLSAWIRHTLREAAKASLMLVLLSLLFLGCDKANQKATQHNIPIKVAIIYNMGGAQAVAREDFHLLSKDAVQVWKETGLLKNEKDFAIDFGMDRLALDKKPMKFAEAVKPYILKTATTDFEGNATFGSVPEGEYYIYGVTETRGGFAVWSYKVSATENKTTLLDNRNAYYSR